jgi:uncharacterized membrane protein YfcA
MVLGEVFLYKFIVEPIKMQEQSSTVNLKLKMDLRKMLTICAIGFLGGYLEGFIGFGYSFSLFLYLLYSESNLKDAVATCGFMNVFLGVIFTLNSVFCSEFHWLTYLVVFCMTLVAGIGSQFLLEKVIEKIFTPSSLNSSLILLSISIMIACLVFLCTSLG